MSSTPFPLPFEELQFSEPSASLVLENWESRNKYINAAMVSTRLRQLPPIQPGSSDASLSGLSGELADCTWLHSQPANSGLFFLYFCDLTVLMQEVLNRLYSVECASIPWADIKTRVARLRASVDLWFSRLPPGLNFTRMEGGNQALCDKMSLAFHYYSVQIMLGRPFLCRRDAHQKSPNTEGNFSYDMAVLTLRSAMHIANIIPDGPDTMQISRSCPWWCILHYAMQAATVILLELSFGTIHLQEEEANLVGLAKKLIRWLHKMSDNNMASYRAWLLCDRALRRLAPSFGYDVSDIPSPPYQQSSERRTSLAGPHAPEQFPKTVSPAKTLSQSGRDQFVNYPHGGPDAGHHGTIHASMGTLPSGSTSLPSAQEQNMDEAYYPYNPFSGDIIRSIFPELENDQQWNYEENC